MGKNSAIEWTDHTWNPWHGCKKVSSGCNNCYMYRDKKRFGQDPTKVVKSKSNFNMPLTIKESSKIFVCSWSDFFIEDADEWRDDAWNIISKTPHLTYLILTKRQNRMREIIYNLENFYYENFYTIFPNVWLGITCENQKMFNERISGFLGIKPAIKFISIEPMLSPINLKHFERIDWVICGGESGKNARPMMPQWVSNLSKQCLRNNIPFFFKQKGDYNKMSDWRSFSFYNLKQYPK